MQDADEVTQRRAPLSTDELVRSALASKLVAISGYDAIIRKIRAGYAVVLYGSLALVTGTKGIELTSAAQNPAWSFAIFLLILAFSLAAFSLI